jgi:hypothetical protein
MSGELHQPVSQRLFIEGRKAWCRSQSVLRDKSQTAGASASVRRPLVFSAPEKPGLVVLLSGALWNRRKESNGYVVILRKARRSRQTPNAGLYQSRQRAHRRAPRRPNNGPHGRWREGVHRHNAGNAYRRCPSCGSCVGFALTPSPSAMKLEPADAGISARRGQAMRPSQRVLYRVLRQRNPFRSTQ